MANASCGYHEPGDLTVKRVFIADTTSIPVYRDFLRHGYGTPLGLIIELTSADGYPIGAEIRDGFCGEAQGMGMLGFTDFLRAARETRDASSDEPTTKASEKTKHGYFVVIPNSSVPFGLRPDHPRFDLAHDVRDICLQTFSSYSGFFASRSNIVRVPRTLIDQAFRTGIRPLPAFRSFDP